MSQQKEQTMNSIKADLKAAIDEARGYLDQIQSLRKEKHALALKIVNIVQALELRKNELVVEQQNIDALLAIIKGQ